VRRAVAPVAAAVAVVVAACAPSSQQHARPVKDADVPFQLLEQKPAPAVSPTTGPGAKDVTVCFVRDAELTAVSTSVRAPVTLAGVLHALDGPPSGSDGQLRSALSGTDVVRSVKLSGGVAQVALGASISTMAPDEQVLAVGQIVCTLTAQPGVGQVAFTLGGAPLPVPTGDGSLATDVVTRDDYAAMLG
jgi:spore germination protein GerM